MRKGWGVTVESSYEEGQESEKATVSRQVNAEARCDVDDGDQRGDVLGKV